IVDRARVATRLVLDDRPDLVDVLLGDGDSVLLQDLDGFLDPLLDVARRRPRRLAATRTETAAARRGRDVAAATTAPAAAAADARCAAAAADPTGRGHLRLRPTRHRHLRVPSAVDLLFHQPLCLLDCLVGLVHQTLDPLG